jgi:hypothetical protein
LIDNSSDSNISNAEKVATAMCGTTMEYDIFELGQTEQGPTTPGTTSYGKVFISNDAVNLHVTFDLIDGWQINWGNADAALNGAHLFVGTQEELLALRPELYFVDENIVHVIWDQLGNDFYPTEDGVNTHTFVIPRSSISVDCPTIVALVNIKNMTTGEILRDLSARANTKCFTYYFQYCLQNCAPTCNTAYAMGDDGVSPNCFYNTPISLNNWGWLNLITPSIGSFSWPLYAGNPDCAPLHDPIGTFSGTYDGTTLTVMYDLNEGFTLDETHLWVGVTSTNSNPLLPWNKKQKKYQANPGGYTHNNVFVEGQSLSFPYTGNLYLAAHAKVCGQFTW